MSIGDIIGVAGAGSRTYGGDTFICVRCGFSYPQGNAHHCPTTANDVAIHGYPPIETATIDVCEQRDTARAERDRARELAASLEQMLAEALRLLELAVTPQSSHALEQQVGRGIVDFLRETSCSS